MRNSELEQAFNTAVRYHQAGRLDEAEELYRRILSAQPELPDPLHLLGAIALQRKNVAQAAELIGRAIAIQPKVANYHNSLGLALIGLGEAEKAVTSLETAIRLDPQMPEAHLNIGLALQQLGQIEPATNSFQNAARLKPNDPEVQNNLAETLRSLGLIREAIGGFRRAVELDPSNAARHSNLLYALPFDPSSDPREVYQEHLAFAHRHAEPLKLYIHRHEIDSSPDRRLRIGYVSPDFRDHAVSKFFEPLLASHDPAKVEAFCYADVLRPDAITARLQNVAHHWRNIVGQTDEQVGQLVREKDRIDILVDLAGHTAGNRILLFAHKLAPIQVTYLGYANSTGLGTIDYRLTDAWADPPGMTEQFHSEQLVRLPETFACYRPPNDAPEVGPLPALAQGHVTFASFNNLAKVNDGVIRCWAHLLRRIQAARLLIMAGGLNGPSTVERFKQAFQNNGADISRIEFVGGQSLADYLRAHRRIDILLDTFPVNGHTVTCHGLWMGVPVITLAGKTHISRLGTSVLNNLVLGQCVAQDPDEYVDIAQRLASDLPRLSELRSGMRQRMRSSSLMDGHRFARNVEEAFRMMWARWIATASK